jgi:hypothetical protein
VITVPSPAADVETGRGADPLAAAHAGNRLPVPTRTDEPEPAPDRSPASVPLPAEPARLMPLLVRTVLFAIAAVVLVYAVLPALLRMV